MRWRVLLKKIFSPERVKLHDSVSLHVVRMNKCHNVFYYGHLFV